MENAWGWGGVIDHSGNQGSGFKVMGCLYNDALCMFVKTYALLESRFVYISQVHQNPVDKGWVFDVAVRAWPGMPAGCLGMPGFKSHSAVCPTLLLDAYSESCGDGAGG